MNLRTKIGILPVIAALAGMYSCYPVDDLTIEDLDIVGTLYDKTYYTGPAATDINKFHDFTTFEVVDTVMHILSPDITDNIKRTYDAYIIQQVRSNMLEMGYTEELKTDSTFPDLALTISVMSSENEVYYWYPYWGYWGYGGYYPYYSASKVKSSMYYYYDYYYPWYGGYGSSYSYTTGTLLIEMIETARIDTAELALPIIWAGLQNGLMEDTQANIKVRISKGIDQCFNQSPYLFKDEE